MRSASYSKERKLSFIASGLTFSKIPVLTSVQLTFYQKYIILFLQKGIQASSITNLVSILSDIINVSETCILEFVQYMIGAGYLTYNLPESRYILAENLHFTMKPELNNAMFADLDVKEADCESLIYLDGVDDFFLDSDFPRDYFTRKETAETQVRKAVSSQLRQAVSTKAPKVRTLIQQAFENTNIHICSDVTFQIKEFSQIRHTIEFPVTIRYKYSFENRESVKEQIVLPEGTVLPPWFVDQLVAPCATDKKIPRFIELDDAFYQKIQPMGRELIACEQQINETETQLLPIREDMSTKKEMRDKERKAFKKAKQKDEAKKAKIIEEITKKENEIRKNEDVIPACNIADSGDAALIVVLKETIQELKNEKKKLASQVKANEDALEEMELDFASREDVLNSEIEKKQGDIENITGQINDFRKQQQDLKQEYTQLLNTNQSKLHTTIKAVAEQYPPHENIFYRYVSEVCIQLDSAISASECEAYDEMGNSIDKMREMYRKVMQAVFDLLMNKSAPNLGSYFTDPFMRIAVDEVFKKRQIAVDINRKMMTFHHLANAIGHSLENGPKKKINEQCIADFKIMTVLDREKTLLAIPNFFHSIKLTKKEVKTLIGKLGL